jgi:hypothetical protein
MTQNDMNASLFTQLVVTLATSTLQQMGKLMNPITHKMEVNLEAAQTTIDLLDMLQAKTQGNLATDEDKMLRETITALKLNYVETSQNPPTTSTAAQPPPPETGAPGDDKQPKYHKKYE